MAEMTSVYTPYGLQVKFTLILYRKNVLTSALHQTEHLICLVFLTVKNL